MASHVYLLRHAQHPRFKVGKANDILSRARSFDWSTIDFAGSLGLSMASEAAAYSLERILLRTFGYARLPIEAVVSSGDRRDGASEWLDMGCLPRLLRYLADNADLHPHTVVAGEALSRQIHELSQPSTAALARAQMKREKEARREERQAARLAAHRLQMTLVEGQVVRIRAKLAAEFERLRRDGAVLGICHGRLGASLILAASAPSDNAELWQLELQDTQYRYTNGAGTLICSISQAGFDEGTLCAVSLPSLELHEDHPCRDVEEIIHRILAEELAWLRTLPAIAEESLGALFWFSSAQVEGETGEEERTRNAARLLVEHRQAQSNLSPSAGDAPPEKTPTVSEDLCVA